MSLRSLQTGTVNVEGRLIRKAGAAFKCCRKKPKFHPHNHFVEHFVPILTTTDAQTRHQRVLPVFAGKELKTVLPNWCVQAHVIHTRAPRLGHSNIE